MNPTNLRFPSRAHTAGLAFASLLAALYAGTATASAAEQPKVRLAQATPSLKERPTQAFNWEYDAASGELTIAIDGAAQSCRIDDPSSVRGLMAYRDGTLVRLRFERNARSQDVRLSEVCTSTALPATPPPRRTTEPAPLSPPSSPPSAPPQQAQPSTPPPPPVRAERWNAVAGGVWRVNGKAHVATGYSGIQESAEKARERAVQKCREAPGRNCKATGAWNSGCVYITVGSTGRRVGWQASATVEGATKACQKAGFKCKEPIGGCID